MLIVVHSCFCIHALYTQTVRLCCSLLFSLSLFRWCCCFLNPFVRLSRNFRVASLIVCSLQSCVHGRACMVIVFCVESRGFTFSVYWSLSPRLDREQWLWVCQINRAPAHSGLSSVRQYETLNLSTARALFRPIRVRMAKKTIWYLSFVYFSSSCCCSCSCGVLFYLLALAAKLVSVFSIESNIRRVCELQFWCQEKCSI